MNYYLIKGHFHVVKYSPDGDSLTFEASNKKNWGKITSAHMDLFEDKLEQGKGVVQLRLQGIDALETHYSPSSISTPKELSKKEKSKSKKIEKPTPGKYRQPEKYGEMATSEMLKLFGIKNMTWRKIGKSGSYLSSIEVTTGKKTKTYTVKNEDPLVGYIVVNDIERKGRPISWVFAGKTRSRDGSKITTSKLNGMLHKSINHQLLANGLVYPYFFYTLAATLRTTLVDAVNSAKDKKLNIWEEDKTMKGISLKSATHLTTDHLIFPYLFRRMIKHQHLRKMQGYWAALNGKKSYKADDSLYLETFYDDTNPYVYIIDGAEFQRLDTIVSVKKGKIKMNKHPGDIVFLS